MADHRVANGGAAAGIHSNNDLLGVAALVDQAPQRTIDFLMTGTREDGAGGKKARRSKEEGPGNWNAHLCGPTEQYASHG